MHSDIRDLRDFYYRTGLGRAAREALGARIRAFWPSLGGLAVVGYGFAPPVLEPCMDAARRVVALMPAPQGVMPWPPGEANVCVLCEESFWPLQTGFADRLVVLHGLEASEAPARLLDECARVLAPGGKALFVAPGRLGSWARRGGTPFSAGRSYGAGGLEAELRRHGLVPERRGYALFQPPSERRFWLRAGPALERMGQRLPFGLGGGAVLVEAGKASFAAPKGVAAARRRPVRILEGIGRPEAEPV